MQCFSLLKLFYIQGVVEISLTFQIVTSVVSARELRKVTMVAPSS